MVLVIQQRYPSSVIRRPSASSVTDDGQRMTDNALALRQRALLPCLRQHPLREVESLGQLAHLRLEPQHPVFQVRHAPLPRGRTRFVAGHVPAYQPPPVAIPEITGRDHPDVLQLTDPHTAE